MSGALVAIVLSTACVSILAPTIAIALVAMLLFMSSLSIPPTAGLVVLVVALVSAVPAAALLSVSLLRSLITRGSSRGRELELLAAVLATFLALQNGGVALSALQIAVSGTAGTAAVLSLIVSRVVLCAGVIALVVSSIVSLSEACVVWMTRATGLRYPIPQDALRYIVVLIAVGGGLDLIIGLWFEHLAPLSLIARAIP